MTRARFFYLLRIFAVITVFLLLFIPLALGFMFMVGVTHMPCGGDTAPDIHGMTDFERVTFTASTLDREVRAYLVRGTNGVTIILPPTGGSGAGYWRPEYRLLHAHGYNLFNFESRRCIGLPISLGYSEVDEVGDALAYLEARGDVDMTRVGAHGFSSAGATSIMAAARYPQIGAVIAEGGYHDFDRLTDDAVAGQWFAPLYRLGADAGYGLVTGMAMSVLSPISVIDRIAPRPVLLVYGTRESSLYGGRLQYEAAGHNVALFEVPGAGHGDYYQSAPQEYTRRIIAFLDDAFGIAR
jgi:dipeptidyl aminopeptidase/acylaminoacyl peptidase